MSKTIIATFHVRVTLRQADTEKPEDAEVQTPTNEGIERVVTEAISATWPWLTATARSERTDA